MSDVNKGITTEIRPYTICGEAKEINNVSERDS